MTDLERTLLETLVSTEQAIAGTRTPEGKARLATLLAQLDELSGLLPADTDPNLLHYLGKKSYAKARLFLEGRQSENKAGSCPR